MKITLGILYVYNIPLHLEVSFNIKYTDSSAAYLHYIPLILEASVNVKYQWFLGVFVKQEIPMILWVFVKHEIPKILGVFVKYEIPMILVNIPLLLEVHIYISDSWSSIYLYNTDS